MKCYVQILHTCIKRYGVPGSILAMLLLFVVGQAPAYAASTHPSAVQDFGSVLLVHGYNGDAGGRTPQGYDCSSFWANEITALSTYGNASHKYARLKTVGYYNANTNCDINLNSTLYTKDFQGDTTLEQGSPYNILTYNTPMEHVAYRLAWAIAEEHQLNGKRPVAIIADSLGGIITRWMVVQVLQGNPDYPTSAELGLSIVCTFGSPFKGTDYASFGKTVQARESVPGSAFLTALNAEARAGVGQWFSFTSNFNNLNGGGDGFISAKSACLSLNDPNSYCYRYDNPAYLHGQYKDDSNFTSNTDTFEYAYAGDPGLHWIGPNHDVGAAYVAAELVL